MTTDTNSFNTRKLYLPFLMSDDAVALVDNAETTAKDTQDNIKNTKGVVKNDATEKDTTEKLISLHEFYKHQLLKQQQELLNQRQIGETALRRSFHSALADVEEQLANKCTTKNNKEKEKMLKQYDKALAAQEEDFRLALREQEIRVRKEERAMKERALYDINEHWKRILLSQRHNNRNKMENRKSLHSIYRSKCDEYISKNLVEQHRNDFFSTFNRFNQRKQQEELRENIIGKQKLLIIIDRLKNHSKDIEKQLIEEREENHRLDFLFKKTQNILQSIKER